MRKKTLICKTWSPLAHRPSYPVQWDDIWVTFKNKRKNKAIGLTLVSGHDIDKQIEWSREANEIMKKKNQEYADAGKKMSIGNEGEEPLFEWDPNPAAYEEDGDLSDVPCLLKRKEFFENNPKEDFFCEGPYEEPEDCIEDSDYFEIITRNELTKETAEKAIEWYLKKENLIGQVNLRFRWPKPKFFITPVGI